MLRRQLHFDPCAFSSPRLRKVPESKQHSRSGWNQSGAVSTGIAVQLALPSEKAPALAPLPPSHQPPTWSLRSLAIPRPSSALTLGHISKQACLHAIPTLLSLPRSEKTAEGNFSQDGEFESLSLPRTAPGSPKRSAMEPECKGEILPASP